MKIKYFFGFRCIDCGRVGDRYAGGRCYRTCYTKYLYHNSPERRKKQIERSLKWMKDNSERQWEIQQKANKRYYQRCKEKKLKFLFNPPK